MKAKKVLALVLCAALLVAGSVAATLAYLTSKTEVVTNTFSVGNVTITLDEAKVDLYGEKDGNSRVTKNTYKLIPGHTYVKDPTVHVVKGSEECWLFVRVENGIADYEAVGNTTIAAQMVANGWTKLDGVDNVYYHAVVDARNEAKDVKVFESFKIADDAECAAAVVNVTAYAIQADGFENNVAGAWDAVKDAQ